MAETYTMHIFINQDLSMSKGQIAAQVSHVTQIITDELVRKCYENHPSPKECMAYMKWKMQPVTIILRATEEQLHELSAMPESKYFMDDSNRAGKHALTTVGFYPGAPIDELAKNYKLL